MRFLQGSSIEGSCGIWENRGKYVRPLIDCDRKEIEKYLTEQGFEWRTDCTNLDNSYFRNRVRNELVPFLDENFAGWKNSVLGGIKKNRLDFEIIDDCVKKIPFDFDEKKNEIEVLLSDFFDLKDGLKIRFLFECCNLIGKNDRISFSFFEDVVLSLKKVCNKECFDSNSVWFEKHAEDFVIICQKDKLFVKKYAKKQTDLLFFDIIEEDGEYFFNGQTVVVEDGKLIFGETIIKNVCFPLCIRNVQIGDFVKCADGKMKKVADVFSDWHVDEDDKSQILIVQELNSKNQNIIGILGKEFGYFDWIIK
jgi:tRNA(Ile)-lysidine synthase